MNRTISPFLLLSTFLPTLATQYISFRCVQHCASTFVYLPGSLKCHSPWPLVWRLWRNPKLRVVKSKSGFIMEVLVFVTTSKCGGLYKELIPTHADSQR